MPRRRSAYLRRRPDIYSRRLLDALLELYQLLREPRPLDELLQAILDTALRCVPGAQRGSLMVAQDGQLHYRAVSGYDLARLRRVSFPLDLVRDTVLCGDRSAQVEDFTQWDGSYLGAEAYATLLAHGALSEIRRSLVTAILVNGRLYGTLVLDNLHSHAPFPPDAQALARLFAEQAGALIEQALLVEQLRQTGTMLIEAEKLASLGRFIASIAHEINNPLTAVLGYADFLAASDLDPTAQGLLRQLRLGAERVRTIVRNLQTFARQQRSGLTQVNLNLLIEQTLTLKRGDFVLEQISVATELGELPATWADAGQLGQVLLNLLVNAQHALRERPLPRQITLRTWAEAAAGERRLLLSVADNGPGVAPELRQRIFEPFFTTRPAGEGTGLGLSICQGIVEAHGGAMRLDSAPGRGARFVVELPVRPAPVVVAPPTLAPPAAPIPRGRHILLVDDDPDVVGVVRAALARENRLVIAGDGAEGLRLAAGEIYDVVLCDMKMPGMDGPAFYRRLVDARPDLARALLFISGDTSSEPTRAFLEATRRPLLAKPFTPDELYAAIAAL